jgi:hypothetical protein
MATRKYQIGAAVLVGLGLFLSRTQLAALYYEKTPMGRAEQKRQQHVAKVLAQNDLCRQLERHGYRDVKNVEASASRTESGTFQVDGGYSFRDAAGSRGRSSFRAWVLVEGNNGQVLALDLHPTNQ